MLSSQRALLVPTLLHSARCEAPRRRSRALRTFPWGRCTGRSCRSGRQLRPVFLLGADSAATSSPVLACGLSGVTAPAHLPVAPPSGDAGVLNLGDQPRHTPVLPARDQLDRALGRAHVGDRRRARARGRLARVRSGERRIVGSVPVGERGRLDCRPGDTRAPARRRHARRKYRLRHYTRAPPPQCAWGGAPAGSLPAEVDPEVRNYASKGDGSPEVGADFSGLSLRYTGRPGPG